MAFQFKDFTATRPVVHLVDAAKCIYEVFFIVYDANKKKHVMRYKKGINDLQKNPKPEDRKAQAEANARVLWEALQEGWNPLVLKYPVFEKEEKQLRQLTFSTALEYALKLKTPNLSKWSVYDYAGCVRFMKKAAIESGCLDTPVNFIERKDIRLIIATAKELNTWSSKARNKYLTILKSLLTVLVDEERIKFSPAYGIKNEPEGQGIGHRRVTDEEQNMIADYFLEAAPFYLDYLKFMYQDAIRRKELLMIKISDINLQRREILIRAEVAKNNKARIVTIADDLMEILIRRQIWTLHRDWYLFSSNEFAPGEEMYHPNTPTTWWRIHVIEHLKIDGKMYGLKGKGADDKIKAGVPLDAIRTQMGHRSKQMTEVYALEVKEQYKKQLIDGAPSFAKVIEMRKAK